MFWHLSTSKIEARGYDAPGGFERRAPYRAIVSVTLLGATGLAYVGATLARDAGALKKADLVELGHALRDQHGVRSILIERHGRLIRWDIEAALDGDGPLTRPADL